MENNGTENPIKNLWKNLTTSQKIGWGLGVVIAILLIVLLAVMMSGQSGKSGTTEEENITEETYTTNDGNTYTVTTETMENGSGEEVEVSTKMDEYGNVTTTDPNLITTYFPYQVMRQHEGELVELGFDSTVRYSLNLDEENKVITAMIEDCDQEGDKELVERYLSVIPIDLSAYTVEYEVFAEDAICVTAIEE